MLWDYNIIWHEQSRPDRDNYIRIVFDNVESERLRSQFQKRNSLEVDFQGTTYDYDSLMHHGQFIPTETGSITIEVTNNAEYKRQEQPILGPVIKIQFSERDEIQLNHVYNCPGSGVAGILQV